MKRILKPLSALLAVGVLVGGCFSGCSSQQQNTQTAKTGYNLKNDYYEYINGDLLASKEIAKDSDCWTYFDELKEQIYHQLSGITQEYVSRKDQLAMGSTEQKIADLYLSAVNTDAKNQAGLGNLEQYVQAINSASSIEEYIAAIGALWKDTGYKSVIGFETGSADLKDSGKYLYHLASADLVLEKSTFESSNEQELVEQYKQYIEKVLTALGNDASQAQNYANQIFEFQKQIASFSLSESDSYNPTKFYHPYDQNQLVGLFSNINLPNMLKAFGLEQVDSFNVSAPEAEKQLNLYLTPDHLPMLKQYSCFCLINKFAMYLGNDFKTPYLEFMQHKTGALEIKSEEKQANELTQKLMKWDFGKLYVEKYFSEQSKQNVEAIVNDILDAYAVKIDALDWMSASTKEKAKQKLSSMIVKIGYPEQWLSDAQQVEISSENTPLINHALSIIKASHTRKVSAMNDPVDRMQWDMTPQTVNAYYNPSNNEIVFPAAILQAPFYDVNNSYEQNLGGIGSVIGHEITHAFDNDGSQYDENGNFNNWWTDQDYSQFSELIEKVASYYSTYEVIDGLHVNGEQTVGENIADLGGVSCITQIIGNDPEKLQAMYSSYATIWASKYTDTYLKMLVNSNPHSPAKVRVNAVLSSTDGFYQAYPEIKPEDNMYVAPEERVRVW